MRDELRDLDETGYWIYGLSDHDFEYTTELAGRFEQALKDDLKRRSEEIEKEWEDGVTEEVISDLAHYTYVDIQYLWQFVLWRLQGILEGLIVHDFLPETPERRRTGFSPCRISKCSSPASYSP